MLQYTLIILQICLLALASQINLTQLSLVPGATEHYAKVGGNVYHYLRSRPIGGELSGTILLLHGYPDLATGWHLQIPYLTSLGYQVITPDMLGYGGTDSPSELAEWAKKKLSSDMADLMDQIGPGEQIIVGGHDWGAGLAYKLAIWYPDLVKSLFTVAVPYIPPAFGLYEGLYQDIAKLSQGDPFTTWRYQLQWRDFAWERNFGNNETRLRPYFDALFGGSTADNQSAFSPLTGLNLSSLPGTGPSPLLDAPVIDLYARTFAKAGLRGPTNWYRVGRMDWEDDQSIANKDSYTFSMPTLFVGASLDTVFPQSSWVNMSRYFDNLTIRELEVGHWTMIEAPEAFNDLLGEWLSEKN